MTALQERNYLDAEREYEEAELAEGDCSSGNDSEHEQETPWTPTAMQTRRSRVHA